MKHFAKENGLDASSWMVLGLLTAGTSCGVYILLAQLIAKPFVFIAWLLASFITAGTIVLPLFMNYLEHRERKMEKIKRQK